MYYQKLEPIPGKNQVYWGPKIWQDVPPDIKSKPLLMFKKKYANHLIRHYTNR